MRHIASPDASKIKARLQREQIKALYHFTDIRNLPNICRRQLLCSKQRLEREGITFYPGGNDLSHNLDQGNNNWNKISLSLSPYIPMAYHLKKRKHLCFLVIDPIVATWENIEFTDTNATRTNHNRSTGITGLDYIDFTYIHSATKHDDRVGWHYYVQAEVLVPDCIPFEFVRKIVFVSQASMIYAKNICGPQLKFTIEKELFLNTWPTQSNRPKAPLDFPYVENFVLTNQLVDENTVNRSYASISKFSRSRDNCITAIISLYVIQGTEARVYWKPNNIVTPSEQFSQSGQYAHWPSIPLEQLPNGACSVEYYLNNQCWASANFEIIE